MPCLLVKSILLMIEKSGSKQLSFTQFKFITGFINRSLFNLYILSGCLRFLKHHPGASPFRVPRHFNALEINVRSTSTPSTRRAPNAATRKVIKPREKWDFSMAKWITYGWWLPEFRETHQLREFGSWSTIIYKGFIYLRWLFGISAINSRNSMKPVIFDHWKNWEKKHSKWYVNIQSSPQCRLPYNSPFLVVAISNHHPELSYQIHHDRSLHIPLRIFSQWFSKLPQLCWLKAPELHPTSSTTCQVSVFTGGIFYKKKTQNRKRFKNTTWQYDNQKNMTSKSVRTLSMACRFFALSKKSSVPQYWSSACRAKSLRLKSLSKRKTWWIFPPAMLHY